LLVSTGSTQVPRAARAAQAAQSHLNLSLSLSLNLNLSLKQTPYAQKLTKRLCVQGHQVALFLLSSVNTNAKQHPFDCG